ncbi:hypothetical protein GCM10025331_20990 [Actinoplanes utahensis]|nr:hypothetical protein [Actinoplanes utahensis]GIF30653.1 hypothetical protein Aut01nite_36390 [Actinoplanes utahensis]
MDEERATTWSADSAAPTSGTLTRWVAMVLTASPGVLLLALLFTSFSSALSRGMFLGLVLVDVVLVGVPAGLTLLMWLAHRRQRREVIRVRLSRSEIAVTRADGTIGRYPTSALTGVVVDREHWTDPVYSGTTVLEFRRLKLIFGDVAEQTRPGRAGDGKSFGAVVAGLGVPIERGLYIDHGTTA